MFLNGFSVFVFVKSRSGCCSRCTLTFSLLSGSAQAGPRLAERSTLGARCIMGEEGKAGWTVLSLAPGGVLVCERRLFSSQPLLSSPPLPWTAEARWFPARAPSFSLAPRPSISAGKSSPAALDVSS